jgi:hypothetical protein
MREQHDDGRCKPNKACSSSSCWICKSAAESFYDRKGLTNCGTELESRRSAWLQMLVKHTLSSALHKLLCILFLCKIVNSGHNKTLVPIPPRLVRKFRRNSSMSAVVLKYNYFSILLVIIKYIFHWERWNLHGMDRGINENLYQHKFQANFRFVPL